MNKNFRVKFGQNLVKDKKLEGKSARRIQMKQLV